jgi:hypothetical protein
MGDVVIIGKINKTVLLIVAIIEYDFKMGRLYPTRFLYRMHEIGFGKISGKQQITRW